MLHNFCLIKASRLSHMVILKPLSINIIIQSHPCDNNSSLVACPPGRTYVSHKVCTCMLML